MYEKTWKWYWGIFPHIKGKFRGRWPEKAIAWHLLDLAKLKRWFLSYRLFIIETKEKYITSSRENCKLSNESLQENGTATRWSNIMVSFCMVHNSGIFWKYVGLFFFNYRYCGMVAKNNGGVCAWQLVVSVLSLPSLASNVDTATLENSPVFVFW